MGREEELNRKAREDATGPNALPIQDTDDAPEVGPLAGTANEVADELGKMSDKIDDHLAEKPKVVAGNFGPAPAGGNLTPNQARKKFIAEQIAGKRHQIGALMGRSALTAKAITPEKSLLSTPNSQPQGMTNGQLLQIVAGNQAILMQAVAMFYDDVLAETVEGYERVIQMRPDQGGGGGGANKPDGNQPPRS